MLIPAPRPSLLCALSLIAAFTAACGPSREQAPGPPNTATPATPAPAEPAAKPRVLTVFAAASLREAFTQIGAEFERGHPGVSVELSFAGTQELRTQIEHGAAADVLASADQRHMDALVAQGKVAPSVLFAHNEPVIAVAVAPSGAEPNAPAAPDSLADLPQVKRLVIAAPEVPLGRYTLQILERGEQQFGKGFAARVEARVVSRENNARQVLAKVSLGEADAAIVYRSDALAAKDKVRAIPIAANLNVIADYPIATVTPAPQPELARAFIALVLADPGQAALERAGFTRAAKVTAAR